MLRVPLTKAERVVGGTQCALGGGDGVCADRAGGRRGGDQTGGPTDDGGGVVVDESGDGVGEAWVGRVKDLGGVVGRDGQSRLGDGEGLVHGGLL